MKAQLFEGKLLVAQVECNSIADCEREIQHYYMMYSGDGNELTIKRNYKIIEEKK